MNHVINSDKGVPSPGTTQGGPIKARLQTGERISYTSSEALDQSGRAGVLFRVVGDNSFGWAEAVAFWGGNIKMVIHRHKSNHLNHEHVNLPRSISYAEAFSLTPTHPSWDGIFLGTIRGP